MVKDYTPYGLPPASHGDLRNQFTASDEMVLATLRHALHARTRELDAALTKIAILQAMVNVYETDPLRTAYERLTATGATVTFVGEIKAGDTPRIQASGELLAVLETLTARRGMFETQRIEREEAA